MRRLLDTRWKRALGLLLLAALIALGLLLAANAPPLTIDTTEGDASIFFQAERGAVAFSGTCLQVNWHVENIREVYLNNNPVVGEGEDTACVYAGALPTLRVVLQDGREVSYTLDVAIEFVSPLANLLALGALILAVSGLYLLAAAPLQSAPARAVYRAVPPVVLMTLITLLLIEFGLRTYFSTAGTREERIMYLYSRAEIQAQDPLVLPMPYVNYIPNPAHPDHNSLGYRGPEITIPKPDGVFRIVAIGGSTTYSTGTTSEESYPALLQQALNEQGYPKVEVINAGMSGYSSWESLVNVAFRLPELEPDMIIWYAAPNDIVPREQGSEDCYRGDNALRGLNVARGLWVERDEPLSPFALYRFIAINLGWMPNPLNLNSAFELPDVRCNEDPPGTTLDQRVAANRPVYYERNLRNILYMAQGNGVIPMLSTWAYYVDGDRPAYWRTAVDEENTIVRDLAAEFDTPFYDLAESYPVGADYWEPDGIHMIAAGTQEQAAQYAAYLIDSGLLPTPPA